MLDWEEEKEEEKKEKKMKQEEKVDVKKTNFCKNKIITLYFIITIYNDIIYYY